MRVLITVLGMHRSGTSAVTGMLGDYGVELGPLRDRNAFNPRGNREQRPLRRLHEAILERNGGSWWRPPASVEIRDEDRRVRDAALEAIEGEVIGVKDPRMLLLMDLWRDLEPRPIGVIRNPVAVCESLDRRSRTSDPGQRPERQRARAKLPQEEWEALWRHYNRILLAEFERAPGPIVDFDRPAELAAQVRAALAARGIEPRGDSSFFDPALASPEDESWRRRVASPESVELWERLRELSRTGL